MKRFFLQFALLLALSGWMGSHVPAQVVPSDPGTREHILLHTDRDVYIAGEELLFSLYLVSGAPDPAHKSRFAYLALRNTDDLLEKVVVSLDNGSSHGAIYLHDTLSTGFYELVGFTNWMRNQGESSYFRKSLFIANRFDETLGAIQRPSSDYVGNPAGGEEGRGSSDEENRQAGISITAMPARAGQRSLVRLQLESALPAGETVHVSMSVAEAGAYFDDPQGWTDDAWQPVVPGQAASHAASPSYYMETRGPIISGFVRDAGGTDPLPGARVVLNTPDTLINMIYADADRHGGFHFVLNDFYYEKDIFLSVARTGDMPPASLSLSDKFRFEDPPAAPPLSLVWDKHEAIRRSQDILRARKAYGIQYLEGAAEGEEGTSPPPLIYGKSNLVYYTDHYVPMDDLWEISREVIQAWRSRQAARGSRHTLISGLTGNFIEGEPVFFLDGIMAEDPSPYMDLGSRELFKIEVHNLEWMHGGQFFPGIVGIFTREPGLHLDGLNGKYVRTRVEAPARPAAPISPSYGENAARQPAQPDLRQVLLWEPALEIRGGQVLEVPFYSGDLSGRYVVTVRGLRPDGIPVYAREVIYIQ
jgi:hypothetical protein